MIWPGTIPQPAIPGYTLKYCAKDRNNVWPDFYFFTGVDGITTDFAHGEGPGADGASRSG